MSSQVHEIWFRNSVLIKMSAALGLFPKSTGSNRTIYSSVRLLKKVLVIFTLAMVPAQIPNVFRAFNFKFTSAVVKIFSTYSLFSSLAIVYLHLRSFLKRRPTVVRKIHRPVSSTYYKTVMAASVAQSTAKVVLAAGSGFGVSNVVRYFNAVCQEVTDSVVTLVIVQFCSNVDTLAEFQRLSTLRLHNDVLAGVDRTEKIHGLYDSYNLLYGQQITWAFVHYLTKIIIMSYYTWSYWLASQHSASHNVYYLVRNVVAIPFMFVPICLPIASCQNIKNLVDAFYNELFHVMRKNGALCKDKKLWLYATLRRTVSFSACGLFTLGHPLITSLIAATTTYSVLLSQFGIDDSA